MNRSLRTRHAVPRWLIIVLLAQACQSGVAPSPAETPRPSPAVDSLREGERAAQRGDLVRAEQYLANAWRHRSNDRRALRLLVHVCIGASRLQAAHRYLQAHLLREPEAWPLRYVLASLDLALGRSDQARRQLLRVVEAAPRHADAYYLLARLASDATTTTTAAPGARALYAKYLQLSPTGTHADEARRALREPEPPESTHDDAP